MAVNPLINVHVHKKDLKALTQIIKSKRNEDGSVQASSLMHQMAKGHEVLIDTA